MESRRGMYYLQLNGAQAGPYSLDEIKALWKEGKASPETLYWKEGMPEWKPLGPIMHLAIEADPVRVICGFWRRLVAYVLDTLMLAALGFVLVTLFYNVFLHMGGWALLVGLTIALLYFGLLNSSLGRGQTLGKKMLGIEVMDHEGRHLSPARSILRYLVFAFPYYLNSSIAYLGLSATSWPILAISFLAFAGGGAITYLYIFNRRTRQSLHDLTVGSYVVTLLPGGKVDAPPIWKVHFMVLGTWLIFLVAFMSAAVALLHLPALNDLSTIEDDLIATGKVSSASVTKGVNWQFANGKSSSQKVFTVQARWKTKTDDHQAAANEIAAVVLKDEPDIFDYDLLTVSVTTGVNIGIYGNTFSRGYQNSPAEWEKLVSP